MAFRLVHRQHDMTANRDLEAVWTYHDGTKHSYASIRAHSHFLDWANQPLPFKIYPTLEPYRLPGEVRQTGIAALSAIADSIPAETNAAPDLEAVGQLLYLSAGITRKREYPGGEIYFRAAACTGALYEVELYLVCGELASLPAGRRVSLRAGGVRPAQTARRRLSPRAARSHRR